MQALITVILPVFLLIGSGWVATRAGLTPPALSEALTKFSQTIAFPCLLYRAVVALDIAHEFNAPLLVSYYAAAGACFYIGMFGARFIFRRDWEDCVVVGFCCLFSNTLMLAIPITERAYGHDALASNFAIVAIHAPFCYVLGIVTMEVVRSRGQGLNAAALGNRIFKQVVTNPLVVALAIGFVVNLGGLTTPAPVYAAVNMLANAAVPVGLFAIGGVLTQYRLEGDGRLIAMVCGITLMLHPTLMWSFGRFADLPQGAFRSAVITAAVAPGVNTYVFANIYGRAKRVAASSVLLTTIGSILTVWLWLSLLP
ncbi:malonate transporter [Oceanicola sp. 22II-s10i]|uniref:AEC family transporter n=1 Tax=Oceanicola sp. 22II-s10i TaxID=1317116 RepID=UPI000B52005D|nr:AEC family transporter [Oceanicola sp. 22II-s10i]OWU85726.1 malonate transporter [Oceanicola sp. 22II-s10i]